MRAGIILIAGLLLAACNSEPEQTMTLDLTKGQTMTLACNTALKAQQEACGCIGNLADENIDTASYDIALDIFNGTVSKSSAQLTAGKLPYAKRKSVEAFFLKVDQTCKRKANPIKTARATWSAWKSNKATPEFKQFLARSASYTVPKATGASASRSSGMSGVIRSSSPKPNSSGGRKSGPKKPSGKKPSNPKDALSTDGPVDRPEGASYGDS